MHVDSIAPNPRDGDILAWWAWEFARRVRTLEGMESLPLIAVSSMRDDTIATTAVAAGFNGFQSKLDQDVLLERLVALSTGRLEI